MRKLAAALLIWLALSAPAFAVAIGTPVTLGSTSENATSTSKAITTAANISTGDLVVCVFSSNGTIHPTFADSGAVNSYTVVEPNAAGANSAVWAYVFNASAVNSGGTITASYASTGGRKGFGCVGVSGITTTSARDTAQTNSTATLVSSTTSASNLNTGVLSASNEILFAGLNSTGGTDFGTFTPPGNWQTALSVAGANVWLKICYQIVSAPVSVGWAPTWGTAVSAKSWVVGAFIGTTQPANANTGGGMMGVVP